MNHNNQTAKQLALGGVLAALAVVLLLLGGVIPVGTYIAPMLASLPLIVLLAELPKGLCFGWYAVVAVLGVILCPDKETAFVFVFLGWYPVAKPALDRLPRLPRIAAKLLVFNLAVAALYALLILVFRLEALVQEAKETGLVLLLVLLVLGNVTFLLYDILLNRLTVLYRIKK
ncbi:MAG: hypothetical protein IKH07_03510 [Oscillospiraceae bacterium]|nr:hypothetical protein [Oscillospiraceae bacterium]